LSIYHAEKAVELYEQLFAARPGVTYSPEVLKGPSIEPSNEPPNEPINRAVNGPIHGNIKGTSSGTFNGRFYGTFYGTTNGIFSEPPRDSYDLHNSAFGATYHQSLQGGDEETEDSAGTGEEINDTADTGEDVMDTAGTEEEENKDGSTAT
jgi:hypothetical protein